MGEKGKLADPDESVALRQLHLRDIICCQTAYNMATGRDDPIGADFVYDWRSVQKYSAERGLNLDSFLVLPIAAQLERKKLRSPVLFWYSPLKTHFVVTVTSRRDVDFMNPLHSLPGYAEYGTGFLRAQARPLLYWTGDRVVRTHLMLGTSTSSQWLVADFGNAFGLSVAEASRALYESILENPACHFDYLAVPREREQVCSWDGRTFAVHHASCVVT